jgi:hypothetical protein
MMMMMRKLTMGLGAIALSMLAAPANAQGIYFGGPGIGPGVGPGPGYYTLADSNDPYWRHRRAAYYNGPRWGYDSYAYVPALASLPGVYYDAPGVAVTVGPRAYYRSSPWGDRWGHRHSGYWQAASHPRIYYNAVYAQAPTHCHTVMVRRDDGSVRRVRRCH